MGILSLYDVSGLMVAPWVEAGHQAVCVDMQHPGEDQTGLHWKLNWNILESEDELVYIGKHIVAKFMMAFPPCDDMAVSGAKHFGKKADENPYFQLEARELALVADRIGRRLGVPYALENPVSRLATLWRASDYSFEPFEFGGYLPEWDIHPLYPDYIAPRDAYTKATHLWTGGGYELPEKRPVKVNRSERWNKQTTALGGSSAKTKNIRSATPRGFALANFLKYGG